MVDKVAILIPEVDRLENIERIIPNIRDTALFPHNIYVMAKDPRIIKYCKANKVHCFVDEGDDIRYVTRINYMYRHTKEPYIFTGASDVEFVEGWLLQGMARCDSYHPVVTYTNEGEHLPTMFLMPRYFIKEKSGCIDVLDVIFNPAYNHYFCDLEFYAYAMQRHLVALEKMVYSIHLKKHDHLHQLTQKKLSEDQTIYHERKKKFDWKI